MEARAQAPTDSPAEPVIGEAVALLDTVLVCVEVERVRLFYAAGHRTTRLDSATLRNFQGEPLSEALTYGSGLSIKQYGTGQLATPAFRGTGASQTAVRWNGLPIQHLTLGQQDLALIPGLAADGVSLVHGATGTQTGDASLGGAILLSTSPENQRGFGLSVLENYSTLRNHSTSLVARYGGEKAQGTTRLFRADWQNQFTYVNPDNFAQRVELRNRSPLTQTAFLQDFHWRVGENLSAWASAWLQHTDRDLQPTIGTPSREETQLDQNQRFAGGLTFQHRRGQSGLSLGFSREVIDYQLPSSAVYSRSTAFQYLLDAHHTQRFAKGGTATGGLRQQWFAAAFSNYGIENPTESRQEVYAQVKYNKYRFVFDLGARQPFSSDFQAPILPSAGVSYFLLSGGKGHLDLKTAAARSYRAPSLNDRYWTPGGNPDLLPETGWSAEAGLAAGLALGRWHLSAEATHFQLWAREWIVWTPVSPTIWSPFNVQSVHSRGLEASGEIACKGEKVFAALGGHYTYTIAEGNDGEGPLESANGRQLLYVPRHLSNLRARLGWKGFELWGLLHNTSRRFTARDNSAYVKGYSLLHLGLSKRLDGPRHALDVGLQVRNLTAEVYENFNGYAQPGRYYLIQLNYTLKPNSNPNPKQP